MLVAPRSALGSLALLAGLLCATATAHAQELPTPAISAQSNIEQIHAAFVGAGYRVDPVSSWDWTSPPVSSFALRDTASGRVVLVLVYPTPAAADLVRQQAAARDGGNWSSPHLVAGYGPSVWSGTAAMVQSTESQLARLALLQADRDNGVYLDPALLADPTAPALAVDVDFQQALESSAGHL